MTLMHLDTCLPTLLDLLLKSTVVLVLAAGIARVVRRASAANRHMIWLAAFVTLLLLPATQIASPLWTYQWHHELAAAPGLPPVISKTELPSGLVPGQQTQTVQASTGVPRFMDWSATAVVMWLIGGSLLLVRRSLVGWRVRTMVRRGAASPNFHVQAMMRELAEAAGVRAQLRVSNQCPVPMAYGIWQPVVLLPLHALDWSDERLVAALQHELGHLRRGDCLARLLSDAVCALYWVNPLVWMASRALRVAQEQACDDLVLRSGADATDYACQLVDVVRSLGSDRLASRHAMAMAQPSTLEIRVRSIVDATRDRRPLNWQTTVGGWLAALTVLTTCGIAQFSAAEPAKQVTRESREAAKNQDESRQVLVESKFVEISAEATRLEKMNWLEKLKPNVSHEGVLGVFDEDKKRAMFQSLAQTKGVSLFSSPSVTTRSGQKALVEVIREFSQPTQWNKNSKSGGWMPDPASINTQNVGVTLGVEAVVTAAGMLDLKLNPKIVEFMGFRDLDGDAKVLAEAPDPSAPFAERLSPRALPHEVAGRRITPIFSTRTLDTSATMAAGQTIVMEYDAPPVIAGDPSLQDKAANLQRPDGRRFLVFVTARFASPAPASKPMAITANSITLDNPKGVTTFTGDVVINTPQAVITADKAEMKIKSRNPTALEKARSIRLSKVEFRAASVADCLDDLHARSIEQDPDHKGVDLLLKAPDSGTARITLSLADIPLAEALQYVASLAGLEVSAESSSLTLRAPGPKAPGPSVADVAPPPDAVLNPTVQQIDKLDSQWGLQAREAKGAPRKPETLLNERASKIIIARLDVTEATLDQCVDYLRAKSREFDPSGLGVTIVLKPSKSSQEARISLDLKQVPVSEALKYVSALAGLELHAQGNTFVIEPK